MTFLISLSLLSCSQATANIDEELVRCSEDTVSPYPCELQGRCWREANSELRHPSDPTWSTVCRAIYDTDCQDTLICAHTGRCRAMHGQCVAVSQEVCEDSPYCISQSHCNYFEIDGYPICHSDGNCQIVTDEQGLVFCQDI
jgi:hypothetical protein